MALTWPGVPVIAWASIRPSVSKTPADRSPASRTAVENAVRTSAWACSSTTDSKRFHMTCMWMSSRVDFSFMADAFVYTRSSTMSPRALTVALNSGDTTVVV